MSRTIPLFLIFIGNCFASDVANQIGGAILQSIFSILVPLLLLGLGLSIILSLAQKKPEFLLKGCGGIFCLLLACAVLSIVINFVKEHSTFFIIGGIAAVFIVLICILCFKDDKNENVVPDKPRSPSYEEPKSTYTSTETHKEESFYLPQEPPATTETIGKEGEDAVSKGVWAACQFDGRHYKILRNVYVPKSEGKSRYSEIDILLLHETGVYVFESKNISGKIYGDNDFETWNRYKGNTPESFPNPIRQNRGHIAALSKFLNQNKWQFRVFNIIVFGIKAQLKKIPPNNAREAIYEVHNLEIELVKKFRSERNFYSPATIDEWCAKLLPCTELSPDEKLMHKNSVERTHSFG